MPSSSESTKRRLRMMMLLTALAGGEVMLSSIGMPMFRPPLENPEFDPTPTIVLSEVTSCIGPGNASIPLTRMTRGPAVAISARNCAAVVTVTVGPPAPPVVPLRPQAFTDAHPSAWFGPGSTGGCDELDELDGVPG